MEQPPPRRFFEDRNGATRIDMFDELNSLTKAALRSFFRRMGAPHVFDEITLPLLDEGDSQIFAAVRDRPWPPWGLGARHVTAVCQTHLVADESFGVSPVYVTDEDLNNVGLIAAVFREAVGYLATSERAEVNYLVAEGSVLADHVLRTLGFEQTDDVFLTEAARYLTYRISAAQLLESLGLDEIDTPELLAQEVDAELLARNALFHSTIYLGSRAEWSLEAIIASEIAHLVRGGHYSKPGGVPTGTGRFGGETVLPVRDAPTLVGRLQNFLEDGEHKELLEHLVGNEKAFESSTVLEGKEPVVNERIRRSRTFDDLEDFGELITERIKQHLDEVLRRIDHPGFPVDRIEIQATASGDGDYFRLHRDGDQDDSREISFVYFLYREPMRFSGGELRVFETQVVDGRFVPTDRSETIVPRQNMIVFFPSHHEHEVLPIRVPSKEFADSRFTVNGWIHRG